MMKKFKIVLGLWVCLLLAACQEQLTVTVNPTQKATLSTHKAPLSVAEDDWILHHRLNINPDLRTGTLSVKDQLRFNKPLKQPVEVWLNAAFELSVNGQPQTAIKREANRALYQLDPNTPLILEYSGQLRSTELCDWLVQACVMLNERGVYLDANSAWHVSMPNLRHTFEMELNLPEGWLSLSQGHERPQGWSEVLPQQSIYLIAGPFTAYRQSGLHTTALVYLLNADEALAKRYLQATQQYIADYSELLGDYPYSKFATVESFWETGWGMPSFTLLGSRVLRLPFILHTSFPHEILHNWWGNSVYVDASEGNWSEGLTAYLADHRLKDAKGDGADYRRDTLQNFVTFTQFDQDFPLREFRGRHDRSTQAVGYGKGLMLFHALKQELGEDAFYLALRAFYHAHRFQPASFRDLQSSFETVSGKDLQFFFDQWLNRTGIAQLVVSGLTVQEATETQPTTIALKLTQQGVERAWPLKVPIVANFASDLDKVPRETTDWVRLNRLEQQLRLSYEEPPLALAIDPNFEVFRRPVPAELPPALALLYNAEPKTVVLSRKVPAGMALAWENWLDEFEVRYPVLKRQYDDEPLPTHGSVILLGGDNAALSELLLATNQAFKLTEAAYTLNSVSYMCGLHSLALTLHAGEQQLILLDASTPQALSQLVQKLPHYGKYSYVLFNSATGENVASGQWPIKDSPLRLSLPK